MTKKDNIKSLYTPYRSCQGSFKRPPSLNAPSQRTFGNPHFTDPLGKCKSFSIKCNVSVTRSIVGLLNKCRPPTILLAVMSFGVNSIYRSVLLSKFFYMKIVRFMHIFFESSKIWPQTPYSFSSISIVRYMVRSITSVSHCLKDIVKSTNASLKSVFIFNGRSATPTMGNQSTSNHRPIHNLFFPAITLKKPVGTSLSRFHMFNGTKFPKLLFRYISKVMCSFHINKIHSPVRRVSELWLQFALRIANTSMLAQIRNYANYILSMTKNIRTPRQINMISINLNLFNNPHILA